MKVLPICRGLFFPIMYQSISLKHPESSEASKSELDVKLAHEGKCIFLTIREVNRQIKLWFLITDIYVSNVDAGEKHHHGLRSCNPLIKFRFHSTSNIHRQLPSLQGVQLQRQNRLFITLKEEKQQQDHCQFLRVEQLMLPPGLDVSTPPSASPIHASQTKCWVSIFISVLEGFFFRAAFLYVSKCK